MYLQEFKSYTKLRGKSRLYPEVAHLFINYANSQGWDILNISYYNIYDYLLYHKNVKKSSEGYLNNIIKGLKGYYSFLVEQGYAKQDRLDMLRLKLKLFKVPRKKPVYLTREDIDKIISESRTYITYFDQLKVKAILYFMFYTGLRAGELSRLKREDINLDELKALIRIPTKSNNERHVFFPDFVRDILKSFFASEPENINAFNISSYSLNYMLKKVNSLLPQKKKITGHCLRHSFANLLAERQIGIRIAQKLLGHNCLQSTLIYYDPDMKVVEKIYHENINEKGTNNEQQDLGPTKTI